MMCAWVCLILTSQAAATYSQADALRFVDYCLASYCCDGMGASGVQNWSCEACAREPGVINVTVVSNVTINSNAFVAYDTRHRSIIVVFAGTDPLSIKNWIQDLDFTTVTMWCSNCNVHRGFLNAYLSIRDPLFAAIRGLLRVNGASTPIQITGHSLGGSMSLHAALDIQQTFHTPQSVYTFGEPRTGDAAFAAYYSSKIPVHYRITHHQDPVPHIPPLWTGFLHQVQEVFYNGPITNGPVICSSTNGEDKSCADQYSLPVDVNDHQTYMDMDFTGNYLRCKFK